ncbi:HEAT repeat domain-containing protein [Candidatus Saganbacteria bacterium]|nr:HEAT repeat domain-containing protein [Candidatus Saganbacteria bacterium]
MAEIIIETAPEKYRKFLRIADAHEGLTGYDGKINDNSEALNAAENFCSQDRPRCSEFLEFLEGSGYALPQIRAKIDAADNALEKDIKAQIEKLSSSEYKAPEEALPRLIEWLIDAKTPDMLKGRIIDAFIERLSNAKDLLDNYDFIREIIVALGNAKNKKATQVLLKFAGYTGYMHSKPFSKVSAEALGKIGDASVAPILIGLLLNDFDVVEGLKYFKGQAKPALIGLLAKEKKSEKKVLIIEALGEVGDDSLSLILIECLKNNDPKIRIAAIDALGDLKIIAAKSRLLELLKSKNSEIRHAARESLGKISGEDIEEELYAPPRKISLKLSEALRLLEKAKSDKERSAIWRKTRTLFCQRAGDEYVATFIFREIPKGAATAQLFLENSRQGKGAIKGGKLTVSLCKEAIKC